MVSHLHAPRLSLRRITRPGFIVLACISLLLTMQLMFSSVPTVPSHLPDSSLPSLHRKCSPSKQSRPADTDALLLAVAEECTKREHTYISITPLCTSPDCNQQYSSHSPPPRTLKVTKDLSDCHPLEIQLGSGERGFGMCTDAAFYVVHLGGRIVPHTDEMFAVYEATCVPPVTTTRLHLETIYNPPPVNRNIHQAMLVNSEQLFVPFMYLHPLMHTFLCKTHFCTRLVQRYIDDKGLNSTVRYMGHSSLDPMADTAAAGGGTLGSAGRRVGETGLQPHPDYDRAIHVRGKSGLKHTYQVLECWAMSPTFPKLTVVASDYQLFDFLKYSVLENVEFVPPLPLTPAVRAKLAKARKTLPFVRNLEKDFVEYFVLNLTYSESITWQRESVDTQTVQRLQREAGIHLCPSEREGFGHYINEGRAVGAVVVSTNHPPMSELVTPDIGVLVKPWKATSQTEIQVLGRYHTINAFVKQYDVCQGVKKVFDMSKRRKAKMGRKAREAFLRERCMFETRLQELREKLAANVWW